jgi:hypothetical protein
LTEFYRVTLPACGVLLDLMSSWVSHLPPEIDYAEVIGHGMNATELAANPRLSRWFIQNLNRDPRLPLADDSIDAAMTARSAAGAAARWTSRRQFFEPVLLGQGGGDLAGTR